jgi:hypothetical protein
VPELERKATDTERLELAKIRESIGGRPGPLRDALGNAVVLAAGLTIAGFIVWRICRWAAHKFAGIQFEPDTTLWVVGSFTLASCLYAVFSSGRRYRKFSASRKALNENLAADLVTEERLEFSAARRFQEPEHGGLFYFLRTHDDKVFVLYDRESQDLGVQDLDPLASGLVPRSNLTIVRTPPGRYVITQDFSDEPIEVGPPAVLGISPARWPEDAEFFDCPWNELDQRLA